MGLLDQYGQWQWPASFTGARPANPLDLPTVPDYAPGAFPFDLGSIFGQGTPPDMGAAQDRAKQAALDAIASGPSSPYVTEGDPTVTPASAPAPVPMSDAEAAAKLRDATSGASPARPEASPALPPPDSFAERSRVAGILPPEDRPVQPFSAVGFMPPGPRDPVRFDIAGTFPESRATISPFETAAGQDATAEDVGRLSGSETFTGEDKLPASVAADQGQADLQESLASNPEMLAQAELDRNAAMQARAAKAEHEQAESEKAAFDAAVKAREDARAKAMAERAQIETDAKAMADGSPFEQWWSTRGTGQKIAGYIGAIFGGLMQGQTGGRNSALDAMMKVADDDAANKWKSIQARREMNGEDLGDADAQFRMQEAIRAASREQMARAIEADLANYDPNGKRAIDGANAVAAIRSANAQALDKYQADAQKQMVDAYNADSQRIQAEAQMLNAQSLAAKRSGMGGGGSGGAGLGGGLAAGGVTYEMMSSNGWRIPAGLKPGQAMKPRAYKAFLEVEQRNGNIDAEETRKTNIALEQKLKYNAVVVPAPWGGTLKQADGSDFLAKTEKEAEAARAKIGQAYRVADMIDQVLSIRDRVGGESGAFNSDEYQQLKDLEKQIQIAMKEGTQGMSSDEDMKALLAAVGASDVTSFRARAAGLKLGRERVVSNMNTYLSKSQGYDGKPIAIPNNYTAPRAKPDPDVDALTRRGGEFGTQPIIPPKPSAVPAMGGPGPVGPTGPSGPGGPGGPSGPMAPVDSGPPVPHGLGIVTNATLRMPTEQQTHLDNLMASARAGGAKGDKAVRMLHTVAINEKAPPASRNAAMRALVILGAEGNASALAYAHSDAPDEVVDVQDVAPPAPAPTSTMMPGD